MRRLRCAKQAVRRAYNRLQVKDNPWSTGIAQLRERSSTRNGCGLVSCWEQG